MLHRFEQLEIDERTRELRGGGRVLTPQPRVFDLIAYLARHRDRVVPKDELLEKLWPDVIVTDASLQRAVSLARSACAELGAPAAIRNYARLGYRFGASEAVAAETADDAAAPAATHTADTNLELLKARAAYASAEWREAIARWQAVDLKEGLCAEDLQLWAHAAQCEGWIPEVALPLERAVAAYGARGDALRAGWVAVLLSLNNLENRDFLAAKGWLHRAARLLEPFPDSREHGYLSYLQARMGLGANEIEPAMAAARRAQDAGRRHGDPDLEYLGLMFEGDIALTLGNIEEGLALLDEAGAAVRSSGISPPAGSLIYCGMITLCMVRADWERAGRWSELFKTWCEEHQAHAVPGICRLHHAEVLNVRGALADAHREIENALALLPSRSPWIVGEAWRILGDIHFEKGDLESAERAFSRAQEYGWETQPGPALLEVDRGNIAQALRLIVRGLENPTCGERQRRGLLLAHCLTIAARAGDSKLARKALAELEANRPLWSTSALRALVTFGRGEIAASENDLPQAIALMRAAIQQWLAIDAPLPAARTRCRLAELLHADGDNAAAERERTMAENVFERTGATGLLARCRGKHQKGAAGSAASGTKS